MTATNKQLQPAQELDAAAAGAAHGAKQPEQHHDASSTTTTVAPTGDYGCASITVGAGDTTTAIDHHHNPLPSSKDGSDDHLSKEHEGEQEQESTNDDVAKEEAYGNRIHPSNPSSSNTALENIWKSFHHAKDGGDTNANNNNNNQDDRSSSTALQVAVQQTTTLLLEQYEQLLGPAQAAMMELEQAKLQIRTLQEANRSKDRELQHLKKSEQQAQVSIAVSVKKKDSVALLLYDGHRVLNH
jgi:hypothetical protein